MIDKKERCMNGVLLGMLSALGKIGVSLVSSLLTEAFLKKAVIIALEKLVKKTENDVDDKLLEAAKEAWKN